MRMQEEHATAPPDPLEGTRPGGAHCTRVQVDSSRLYKKPAVTYTSSQQSPIQEIIPGQQPEVPTALL
jgi:hypothetical protein